MSRYLQVDFLLAGLRDSSGRSLSGGKVDVYFAGTSTKVPLYQDAEGEVAHTNPIILDGRGAKEAYGNGSYKFLIYNSSDVLQYTWDNKEYARSEDDTIYGGTSTGSSNNYSVNPSVPVTALTDGKTVTFIANHATSGAATVNVSGLGAKALVRVDGSTNLTTGDIVLSQLTDIRYIAGNDHFRLVSQAGVAAIASGGTGASTASAARTNLGLGTIATQDSNAVTITGGTISGITDITVADGGTGASDAATARTNLGLGTIATQAASNVAITGGTAILSTLTSGTVQAPAATALTIKADTGSAINFFEGATNKGGILAGTTVGSCFLGIQTDNTHTIGQSSFAFRDIFTYSVNYRNPVNFNNTGFGYTVRTSLNPAAATASNVADYVLTLVSQLALNRGVSFTP
jgi:hypothetical protein